MYVRFGGSSRTLCSRAIGNRPLSSYSAAYLTSLSIATEGVSRCRVRRRYALQGIDLGLDKIGKHKRKGFATTRMEQPFSVPGQHIPRSLVGLCASVFDVAALSIMSPLLKSSFSRGTQVLPVQGRDRHVFGIRSSNPTETFSCDKRVDFHMHRHFDKSSPFFSQGLPGIEPPES